MRGKKEILRENEVEELNYQDEDEMNGLLLRVVPLIRDISASYIL